MSIHEDTRKKIEDILQKNLNPIKLEVIDNSAAHAGHPEAMKNQSAGHFKVIMISEKFNGLNQVAKHRLVYKQLEDLMDSKIHALSLTLNGTEI